MSDELIGVIYALPTYLIDRFFRGKKHTFVKYLGRQPTTRLAPGHKIIFYASHDKKQLLGEATIHTIDFLVPSEVPQRFARSLFLTAEEFAAYTGKRLQKPLMVLQLQKIRIYPVPIASPVTVTMAGRYIHSDSYDRLLNVL